MAPLELFFFPFFLLFFLLPSIKGEICVEASCGDVIVDFPFRLAGQPDCCGNPSFNLSCRNLDQTRINFPLAGEFNVEIIGYSSQNLLISDPCIPKRLLQGVDLSGTPFEAKYPERYLFFNCSSNVSSGGYPAIYFSCLSDKNFKVYAVPTILYSQSSPLRSCLVIATILVPLRTPYLPEYYLEDLLLTWREPDCQSSCNYCANREINCPLADDDGCSSYHFKKKNGLSRGTKYALIFILGTPMFLLMVFLIYHNVRNDRYVQRHPSNVVISSLGEPQPGFVANGLDRPRIEAYPITEIGESCRLPRPNDNTCSICLSEYQAKETIRSIPNCAHYFHANCIDEWLKLNAACPVCRNSPDQETNLINRSTLYSSSSTLP